MMLLMTCLSLHVLIFRYNLQDNDEEEDPLLHRKPNNTLRRNNVPDRARLLPSLRFRREGDAVRLHFAVADGVFPAPRRNNSADVAGRTPAGKIPTFHDDPRHVFDMGDRVRVERPFSVGTPALSRRTPRAPQRC